VNKKEQSSNQQQQQTTTNTYGWQAPPITAETQAVLNEAKSPARIDPSINGVFGQAANQIKNTYNDPFGGNNVAREKSLRSNMLKLGTEKAKVQNQSYFDAQNQKFGQKVGAASLTAPQLTQTGGTSTGNMTANTTQQGGFWTAMIPSLVQGAAA